MQSARSQRSSESKVRAKRLKVDESLTAETRTIGTPIAYLMRLENVSETGFLLSGSLNGRIPYRVNTLIELTLDPNASVIAHPIHLLGRVVRANSVDEQGQKQFGVQIVQMDSKDQASWETFVSNLDEPLQLV